MNSRGGFFGIDIGINIHVVGLVLPVDHPCVCGLAAAAPPKLSLAPVPGCKYFSLIVTYNEAGERGKKEGLGAMVSLVTLFVHPSRASEDLDKSLMRHKLRCSKCARDTCS